MSAVAPAFRPSVVIGAGPWLLVLDDLQPRATVLDPAAARADRDPVVGVTSWSDRPAPSASAWPGREVFARGARVRVLDGPGTSPVDLVVDSSGAVTVYDAPRQRPTGADVRRARRRFWHSRSGLGDGEHGSWAPGSVVTGPRVESVVTWTGRDGTRTWHLGRGGIAGAAAHGTVLAVTVRRADKRPWSFRPSFELAVLHPSVATPQWVEPPVPAAGVWLPVSPGVAVVEGAVDACVAAAGADGRDLVHRGGTELGVGVTRAEVGDRGLPVVDHAFTRPSRPGVRCVRRDEPLSELGLPTGGLQGHGVFLDEDLAADLLPAVVEARDGVLAV